MKGNYRILLVEDDRSIRETLVDLLNDEGYVCLGAADGHEAIEILKENSFELLISDLRMPRVTGAELISWCRENSKTFPVVCISATAALAHEESKAIKSSSAFLLHKPLDLDHFLQVIENHFSIVSKLATS